MCFTKNIFLAVLFISAAMASCNPAQRINPAVEQKKQQDVSVQFPRPHTATPADVNFVYDYEKLFSPVEVKQLDSLLRTFEKSNLIAIKLVTINKTAMQEPDFDTNNATLYKDWDKAHGGTGKVMVISVSREMEKAKADYGPFVAKLLSQQEVAAAVEANRNAMERGAFFDGIWNGLNQLMNTIRRNIK